MLLSIRTSNTCRLHAKEEYVRLNDGRAANELKTFSFLLPVTLKRET